jgi:modulator of FtsH protease HflC
MRQAGRSHRSVLLRRTLPALAVAAGVFALACALFTIDATEYGLVMRFGHVVRVVGEPGLHVKFPFDAVLRLDRRVLFSRLPQSEYLTIDKKNVVIESLAIWRIADPARFLATFATQAAGEQSLADIIVADIGSVIGQYPASALVSADPAESRYRPIVAAIGRRVADFAGPAYGIDVLSLDIRRLSLPEQNRVHVFDRMTAERAKIAKENRSAGEFEARKITAAAEHERVRIEADATGASARLRAQGDAEASRTYAAAFGQDPKFYEFLRTLQAYDNILDDKTTLFIPADAEVLRLLHFDEQPPPGESPPSAGTPVGDAGPEQGGGDRAADADRLFKKRPGEVR